MTPRPTNSLSIAQTTCLLGLLQLQLCFGTPPEVRPTLSQTVIQQMENARTKALPVATIAQLARQAEAQFAQTAPDEVVNIYYSAVVILQMKLASDPEARSTIYELKTRQRQFLDAVPLPERLWRLRAQPLPLNMEFSTVAGPSGGSATWTELDYLLRNWRLLQDELDRTKEVDLAKAQSRPWPPEDSVRPFTNAAGVVVIPIITESTTPDFISDPVKREQFREALAQYSKYQQARTERSDLISRGREFTNAVTRLIALEYGNAPHQIAQLQEVMDGYLPPEISTNVMNKVFASMKPAVAAKTPRPVPGAKGERWVRVAAVEPRGEPALPAIARPSRIREGMNVRGSQGAGAAVSPGMVAAAEPGGGGAGQPGGRTVWPWAVLGLAAVWLGVRQLRVKS